MKKILAILLAAIMMFSLIACGEANRDSTNTSDEAVSTTDNQNDGGSDEEDTSGEEDELYSNKIYYVGDDIPEGTYVVNCTFSEYGMDVVVFQSEAEYAAFQNAEQFTVGEYRNAIEQNAWVSLYIEENESAYIGLTEGNIILLDGGMCEFGKYNAIDSNVLHSGIYVVGKDIPAGSLDIKGTTDYLQVVVFDSIEKYSTYHKTDRFTVGEESDAIEANASDSDYIYGDDITSVRLDEGMVLMIDDGVGEYSIDQGPVVN